MSSIINFHVILFLFTGRLSTLRILAEKAFGIQRGTIYFKSSANNPFHPFSYLFHLCLVHSFSVKAMKLHIYLSMAQIRTAITSASAWELLTEVWEWCNIHTTRVQSQAVPSYICNEYSCAQIWKRHAVLCRLHTGRLTASQTPCRSHGYTQDLWLCMSRTDGLQQTVANPE